MKDLFDHRQDSLSATHLSSIQKNIRYGRGEKRVITTTTPLSRIERVAEASKQFIKNIVQLLSAERVELTTVGDLKRRFPGHFTA